MPCGTRVAWHLVPALARARPNRRPAPARRRTVRVVFRRFVPIFIVTVLLAGCGDDKKEPAAATSSSSVSSTTVSTVETTTTTGARATSTTAPTLSDDSRLGFDGIGPIKIFMTLAQATAAVGKPVKVDPNEDFNGCAFAEVEGGPKGLTFMVNRKKDSDPWLIVRADVHEPSPIATLSGIRVGATEAAVKEAYSGKGGRYTVEPHPYTAPQGHYLIYDTDGNGGTRLIFETDGKKVLSFRAGDEGAVQAIEGCA